MTSSLAEWNLKLGLCLGCLMSGLVFGQSVAPLPLTYDKADKADAVPSAAGKNHRLGQV